MEYRPEAFVFIISKCRKREIPFKLISYASFSLNVGSSQGISHFIEHNVHFLDGKFSESRFIDRSKTDLDLISLEVTRNYCL